MESIMEDGLYSFYEPVCVCVCVIMPYQRFIPFKKSLKSQ